MSKSLTRKELYELIWSKPAEDLAAEYGLSGRGLGKLCERHSIPVPPRGYWQKKKAGQSVRRPPLIMLPDHRSETTVLQKYIKSETITPVQAVEELPEEVKEAIEAEAAPENLIKVSKTLSSPHPIIDKWIKGERKKWEIYKERRHSPNFYSSKPEKPTALEQRRRIILNALFKALESRGFHVYSEDGTSEHKFYAWIGGDKVEFSCEEWVRQYRRQLTEEELAAPTWNKKQQLTQEREYTSQLRIRVGHWQKSDYADADDRPLEEKLNDIMVGIIEAIWEEKRRRLKREEEEDRRRRAEEDRLELQRQKECEAKRREDLLQEAQDWKNAQHIREYVACLKAAGKPDMSAEEFEKWREWALGVAKHLDPSTS